MKYCYGFFIDAVPPWSPPMIGLPGTNYPVCDRYLINSLNRGGFRRAFCMEKHSRKDAYRPGKYRRKHRINWEA